MERMRWYHMARLAKRKTGNPDLDDRERVVGATQLVKRLRPLDVAGNRRIPLGRLLGYEGSANETRYTNYADGEKKLSLQHS